MARCRTAVCISNANPLDTSRDRCHGLTVAFATTTLGLTCLSSYQIINELKMKRNYYFVCEQRKDRLRKKCWYLYTGINDAIPIYQTNDSRMWMYLWCHPCQYNKFNNVWIVLIWYVSYQVGGDTWSTYVSPSGSRRSFYVHCTLIGYTEKI